MGSKKFQSQKRPLMNTKKFQTPKNVDRFHSNQSISFIVESIAYLHTQNVDNVSFEGMCFMLERKTNWTDYSTERHRAGNGNNGYVIILVSIVVLWMCRERLDAKQIFIVLFHIC